MPDDPTAWAAPLPSTRGDRIRAIVPALALAVVAAIGVRNHVDHDQSSWEGASFGMFATYENHVWRVVEVTVTGPDGEYQAALPSDLSDDATRLKVAPSDGAAERLARNALERIDDPGEVTVRVTLYGIALRDDDGFRLRYVEMRHGEASR